MDIGDDIGREPADIEPGGAARTDFLLLQSPGLRDYADFHFHYVFDCVRYKDVGLSAVFDPDRRNDHGEYAPGEHCGTGSFLSFVDPAGRRVHVLYLIGSVAE